MENNELPDVSEEIPPDPQPEGNPNPLSRKKILVTKFSRNKVLLLGGALFIVTALACANALEDKRRIPSKSGGQNATPSEQVDTKPNLPEGFSTVSARYGEASQGATSGVAGYKTNDSLEATGSAKKDSMGDTVPAKRDSLEFGAPTNGNGGAVDVQQNLSPAQQTAQARDQRQKDSVSATRAPLSFGGGNTKLRESAVMPQPSERPLDPSLNRMIDKLAFAGGPGEQDDQNQQTEKRSFTKEDRKDFPYLKTTLLTPISPYEVKAGSILPGVLITGINSDLPGQITAQARENVFDTVSGRYLLIPIGSRFIGEYDSKISYGQERVLVVWTRIIMPNGNSISLENMPGIDLSGYAGVSGSVNNHYGKLITGVVLGSILGAGAQVAVGGQGTTVSPPSFGQLFTAGAATNLNQAGQRITEKNLNLQPTIGADPGQKINIFVTKDMILKPYAD
jgi:type IV secretion system protein TrbI